MILIDSLLLGVQHSFEPDHLAAISVLASDKSKRKVTLHKLIWRSSQWALGHSVSLILFSLLALAFKAVFPFELSKYAETVVGPVMIWLGISAIQRNYTLNKIMAIQKDKANHVHSGSGLHLHGPKGEEIAINPLNRSFWVGMLHGLAGTGGACAVALIMASENANAACGIILLQSLGILIAMTAYSCILAFSMSRFIEKNQMTLKVVNCMVGTFSILIGCLWIYNSFFPH